MISRRKSLIKKIFKKPRHNLFKRIIQIRVSSSVFWGSILILISIIILLVILIFVEMSSAQTTILAVNNSAAENDLLTTQLSTANSDVVKLKSQLASIEIKTWKFFFSNSIANIDYATGTMIVISVSYFGVLFYTQFFLL